VRFQEREFGGRIRAPEAPGMRPARGRAAVRGPVGHRQGQHGQQERGELRVHSAQPVVPVSGG